MSQLNGVKPPNPSSPEVPAAMENPTCLPDGTRAAFQSLLISINVLSNNDALSTIIDGLEAVPALREQLEREKQGREMQDYALKIQLDAYNVDREALTGERSALLKEHAELKTEIAALLAANKEYEAQEARHAARMKELHAVIDAKDEAAQQKSKQIEGLIKAIESERKKKAEVAALLEHERTTLSKTNSDLERCRQSYASLRKKADWDAHELQKAADLTTTLKDDPDRIQALDDLWRKVADSVSANFCADVAPTEIETLRSRLHRPGHWGNPLPLPQSNTEAAKDVRRVAVMAIVARSFTDIIFQPTYHVPPQAEMKRLLAKQARSHALKEASFRAALQALLPGEQGSASSAAIATACTVILDAVSMLLPDEHRAAFVEGLQEIAEEAHDIWWEICSLEECVELRFELSHYKNWEWRHLTFQAGLPQMPELNPHPEAATDAPLFVIFPRAFIISDSQGDFPETHGTLLMGSQTAAAREEEESIRANRPQGRILSILERPKRSRRLSARNESGAGRPPNVPFLQAIPGES